MNVNALQYVTSLASVDTIAVQIGKSQMQYCIVSATFYFTFIVPVVLYGIVFFIRKFYTICR